MTNAEAGFDLSSTGFGKPIDVSDARALRRALGGVIARRSCRRGRARARSSRPGVRRTRRRQRTSANTRGDPDLDDEDPSPRARAIVEWVGAQRPDTVTYDGLVDHFLAADWYPEDCYSAIGEAERLGYVRIRASLL